MIIPDECREEFERLLAALNNRSGNSDFRDVATKLFELGYECGGYAGYLEGRRDG